MAAGIVHAAKKGKMPKSKLRGASKEMFKSMSDTKIKKFAKTKRGGLPKKKINESGPLTARQLFGRKSLTEVHGPWGGRGGDWHVGRSKAPEGRDDASKLGLGKAGMAYARMSSSDVMDQPGGTAKKVTKRYNMIKDVTNQKNIKGFPSMDKVGKVPSAIKDSRAQKVVAVLLA